MQKSHPCGPGALAWPILRAGAAFCIAYLGVTYIGGCTSETLGTLLCPQEVASQQVCSEHLPSIGHRALHLSPWLKVKAGLAVSGSLHHPPLPGRRGCPIWQGTLCESSTLLGTMCCVQATGHASGLASVSSPCHCLPPGRAQVPVSMAISWNHHLPLARGWECLHMPCLWFLD